ncbi:hypothetical protein [Mesorhizobium sp.]|uniref:hypothetical protein n=1 Tax=Mesorhizobium sp. TaxID=1871066 RepID=UPI000FE6C032|nr:hypothetical protein [Mesorhizobium sp.]RWF66852.1 MAG: hypothetical protein EOS47_04500 [Mesorhizobium sp.]
MKIKFIQKPKGRDYNVGDVVDFNGPVEESYATKFLNRGWAEPADDEAATHVEKTAADAEAAAARDAKANADYKAAVKTGKRGPKSGAAKK